MSVYHSVFFCSTLLIVSAAKSGGDGEPLSVEGWISKAETITSTSAKKALSDFRDDVRDLDTGYAKGFEKARSAVTMKLEKARAEASKSDKLDEALKIREAMAELKQVTVSKVGKSKVPEVAISGDFRFVVGRWQGTWGTTGTQLLISISEDGTLLNESDRLQLAVQNNRLLALGATLHQNVEIIPSGNRLIVLGWTASKAKNPLVDQPDHVGILTRAN